jgi:broad specificity phosphatase PhoE
MTGSPGRKLILVRHSLPEIVLGTPASQWCLSDEGRARCTRLAERLREYDPAAVITSQEPKAVETGQIVADVLGIPFDIAEGLHEHERGPVESLGSREAFQALVSGVLERRGELVFGQETGDQARTRFTRALDQLITLNPTGNLAVVSHGTVMTLFIAHATGLDPVPFWRRLGLPAFAVLSLPDWSLLDVIEEV